MNVVKRFLHLLLQYSIGFCIRWKDAKVWLSVHNSYHTEFFVQKAKMYISYIIFMFYSSQSAEHPNYVLMYILTTRYHFHFIKLVHSLSKQIQPQQSQWPSIRLPERYLYVLWRCLVSLGKTLMNPAVQNLLHVCDDISDLLSWWLPTPYFWRLYSILPWSFKSLLWFYRRSSFRVI